MSIAEGRTDAEREVLERLRLKGDLARALDRANELKARVAELESLLRSRANCPECNSYIEPGDIESKEGGA